MNHIRAFFSPAKVNLFLKVLHKRPDGFHELCTLMQSIDFGDILTLESSPKDCLSCNILSLESSENFIWKSLELFRRETGILQPVKWNLKKRIPLKAGLGGGSSNAATALYALNFYFQAQLPLKTLQDLAAEIGSDVPFFFSSGTALGYGRGERVASCEGIAENESYVLYFSSEGVTGVTTEDAYKSLVPSDFSTEHSFNNCKENDLEKAVFRFRKDLLEKKLQLQKLWKPYGGHVLMSGSGGTLFVRYNATPHREQETSKLIEHTRGIPARKLNKELTQWY